VYEKIAGTTLIRYGHSIEPASSMGSRMGHGISLANHNAVRDPSNAIIKTSVNMGI
jgi:hypothetical protein